MNHESWSFAHQDGLGEIRLREKTIVHSSRKIQVTDAAYFCTVKIGKTAIHAGGQYIINALAHDIDGPTWCAKEAAHLSITNRIFRAKPTTASTTIVPALLLRAIGNTGGINEFKRATSGRAHLRIKNTLGLNPCGNGAILTMRNPFHTGHADLTTTLPFFGNNATISRAILYGKRGIRITLFRGQRPLRRVRFFAAATQR